MGGGFDPLTLRGWVCCLNPDERAITEEIAGYFTFVTDECLDYAVWLTMWAGVTKSAAARQTALANMLGLEFAPAAYCFPLYDELPAFFWDNAFMSQLADLFFGGGDGCSGGCSQWFPP